MAILYQGMMVSRCLRTAMPTLLRRRIASPPMAIPIIINGAAVNWSSRKQEKVAKSTAEAEFVAASKTTDEALWMNKLMFDLSLSKPISVHMDNTAAIFQVKELPMRNKYIRIHHSAVFERIRNHEVVLTHISTTDMVADILTKPLAFPEFSKFRAALGVME